MSQKQLVFSQRRLLIPNPLNCCNLQQKQSKERQIQTRVFPESKLFIAPNRESKPLGLAPIKNKSDKIDTINTPSFDNFNLSALFANKIATEEDKQILSPMLEAGPECQTPPRQLTSSGFKRCEQNRTDQTYRSGKVIAGTVAPIETKKSRPKQKGLRKLSQRAYEIVLNMKSASYKEVANKLVTELNEEKELDQEGKDEQNIKRRVYDALNVLIALGVLKKEGRKIVGNRQNKLKFEEGETTAIKTKIINKKNQIRRKKQLIKDLELKQKMLKQLVAKNKERKQIPQCIHLPFIVLENHQPETIQNSIDDQDQSTKLVVTWSQHPQDVIKNDIDCLMEYFKNQKNGHHS